MVKRNQRLELGYLDLAEALYWAKKFGLTPNRRLSRIYRKIVVEIVRQMYKLEAIIFGDD